MPKNNAFGRWSIRKRTRGFLIRKVLFSYAEGGNLERGHAEMIADVASRRFFKRTFQSTGFKRRPHVELHVIFMSARLFCAGGTFLAVALE